MQDLTVCLTPSTVMATDWQRSTQPVPGPADWQASKQVLLPPQMPLRQSLPPPLPPIIHA